MKRILLFVGTNIAVLAVISIVFNLLGLEPMVSDATGLNLTSLLIFSALIGFGGSIISLLLSKRIALMQTGASVIDQPSNSAEAWLKNTVQRQAQAAGIGMPDVAIYDSPEVNAFATGSNRNKALVAVSSGLLRSMSQDEAEAVLGHEVSHVANGDMITLTLIQGVINTFVIFLSRIVGYIVDRVILKNDRGLGIGYFVTSIAAQILLGFLAMFIVNWFSRQREFRADAGGARLAGSGKMIAALERLKAQHEGPQDLPKQLTAFGIAGQGAKSAMKRGLMTHPPLDERIAALKRNPVMS
ncbi:MAG: protease HtpX [Pseudomonadota bacterium]